MLYISEQRSRRKKSSWPAAKRISHTGNDFCMYNECMFVALIIVTLLTILTFDFSIVKNQKSTAEQKKSCYYAQDLRKYY